MGGLLSEAARPPNLVSLSGLGSLHLSERERVVSCRVLSQKTVGAWLWFLDSFGALWERRLND